MNRTKMWTLLLVAPLALTMAGEARALSISGVTIVRNAGNSADTTAAGIQNKSAVQILNAGGAVADTAGAMVTAGTRYSMINAHHYDNFGTPTNTANADYTVTFTVTPSADPYARYSIQLGTNWLGSIGLYDDGANGGAQADVSAVTGRLGGVVTAGLGLPDPGGYTVTNNGTAPQGDNSVTQTIINANNALLLTNQAGTNTYTVRFTWSTYVQGFENGFFGGTDDAGIRLGQTLTDAGFNGTGCTVCNYGAGNAGSRVQANDGHFLNITTTLTTVPEPGTLLLFSFGLAGLTLGGRRKRA